MGGGASSSSSSSSSSSTWIPSSPLLDICACLRIVFVSTMSASMERVGGDKDGVDTDDDGDDGLCFTIPVKHTGPTGMASGSGVDLIFAF
eukprot:42628_1